MKRFIILFLILFSLAVLRAEEKSATSGECKCEQGQENCPCLAQQQVPIKDKKVKNIPLMC